MDASEFKLIRLETLNSFHDFKNQGDKLVFKNMRCSCCNRPVDIEVIKTSSGFGFINGQLSEPSKRPGVCSMRPLRQGLPWKKKNI